MRLEDAMVYVLTTEGRGLSTEQMAYLINRERLHERRDGEPVSSAQIYAAVCRHSAVFVKEGGIIHLVM